jgi:hypothetical protein
MSTYGTNAYGQNIYGGPAVWSEPLSEAELAADSVAASASFVGDVVEAAWAADGTTVSSYVQAPLPVSRSPSMTRALRVR